MPMNKSSKSDFFNVCASGLGKTTDSADLINETALTLTQEPHMMLNSFTMKVKVSLF